LAHLASALLLAGILLGWVALKLYGAPLVL